MDYLTLTLMFKVFNEKSPSYILQQFNRSSGQHGHSTRNHDFNFVLPTVKSQGHSTFSFRGVKLWNNLPSSIRASTSTNVFKFKCKRYLMSEMKEVETDLFIH